MNYRIATLSAVIFVAACQPQAAPPATSSVSPARFEIRDFKLTEVTTEYGGLNVNGRGTLVALDDSMKKGNYLVWFTAERSRKEDSTVDAALILKDGLATIETNDFVSKDDREKVNVRYSDWKMTAYVKMEAAVFIPEVAASAPQK